jgi:hypothetical protein
MKTMGNEEERIRKNKCKQGQKKGNEREEMRTG